MPVSCLRSSTARRGRRSTRGRLTPGHLPTSSALRCWFSHDRAATNAFAVVRLVTTLNVFGCHLDPFANELLQSHARPHHVVTVTLDGRALLGDALLNPSVDIRRAVGLGFTQRRRSTSDLGFDVLLGDRDLLRAYSLLDQPTIDGPFEYLEAMTLDALLGQVEQGDLLAVDRRGDARLLLALHRSLNTFSSNGPCELLRTPATRSNGASCRGTLHAASRPRYPRTFVPGT